MREKRQVFLFFSTSVLFSLAANFAHPVTPTIIQQRGFGDYMFGVALASMMVMNFFFSPFWGRLVSFLSSRRVILICSLGYAVGQVMFGLAATENMMIVARMFAGVFTGGAFTGLLTYIVNTSSERGKHLTIAATIQTVAGSFGYFVGGMLGELNISLAIVAQVAVLAGSGVLFYFVCEDDATTDWRSIEFKKLAKESNPVAAFLAGGSIMTPVLISIFVVGALAMLGNNAFDQSFNYYLKAQLNLSSGYNGTIKAVIGLVSLAANSLIGMWLINRTDIKRSIIYVYLLCTSAMLGAVLMNASVPFVIATVIYFGFYAISVPLTQNLAAEKAIGRDSNLVMGFFNGLKSLGGIFGALAAGMLYTVNPRWPFLLGCAAFAVASVIAAYHYHLSQLEDKYSLGAGQTS